MLNQKIVVGTSWDYPPFSSVDPNFQVVGFDIALIQEIGRRLQIPVEIQNYAFEGLPGALQVNQIDIAVAAVAITPQSLSEMSFSPIYYVNQTAVLARNDGLVPNITDFNQLAGFRVGVRRGSVYEIMAKNLLVDTGLMGTDKLLSYMQTDDSVRDMLENRVDVVILGEATASYYSSQQDLRVVANGFHEQELAVAMRLGTPRLKIEIDRVMNEMLTDGTVLSLVQQYIQNEVAGTLSTPIPPSALQLPTQIAPAPLACLDGMKFVADVTFGDNNMKSPPFVNPGEAFVKTWRLQNTGTCTWTTNYRLVYAYGNITGAQMGGLPINIPSEVAPGQTIDLSIAMTAPVAPASYQGFWQIQNDKGHLFGQAIWAAITTGALANVNSPAATLQPSGDACVVTIVSPKNSVSALSSFDATWMVKNTSGEDWLTNSVDYTFVSGTQMQQNNVYDFTQPIKNGDSANLTLSMIAPNAAGLYTTTWAIVSGNKTLCVLSQTVTVQ
jgi:ABC-type amino acid transport substrate-binding protein